MPFFDDFASALSGYPAASVTLSIVDRVVQPPHVGPAVNTNEIWAFQVRVTNNGNLNMTGVVLHIQGQNGTQVSTLVGGPWQASITSGALTVNAHSSQDTPNFYFKAPSAARPAGTPLVRAHIGTFDVNLNHILNNHSDHADPPSGTYSDQVFPA